MWFLVCLLSLKHSGLEFTSNEDPFPNTNMQNLTYVKHLTNVKKSLFVKINADL